MAGPAASVDVLRPRRPIRDTLIALGLMLYDPLCAVLRRLPIIAVSKFAVVTRNDDVREVLRKSNDFKVIYAANLNIVMDQQRFLLGLDGEELSRDIAAIRLVMTDSDIATLSTHAAERCAALLATSNGTLEVVDLCGQVSLDVFCKYLGVTNPPGQNLRVTAMRLFEFVVFDVFNDADLRAEAQNLASTLRDHIDSLIAERKAGAAVAIDDVLGRCLTRQKAGETWFTDIQIRTLLVGLVFASLPQLSMAAAQILEQLFRRPAELAAAQALARNNDPHLTGYIFEAFRFDPLAPALTRQAESDQVIAAGTHRKTTIKAGSRVVAGLRSAMKDPRRLAEPEVFDPSRAWGEYMLFGDGPHACLAEQIDRALIPLLLGELLKQSEMKRAPGPQGRLLMRGFFPDRLSITFRSTARP